MAEHDEQAIYPPASSTNGFHKSDQESLRSTTEEERRRKRMKWAVYIAAFTVFQVMVILVFALVVMKVKAPKFRVGDLEIQTLTTDQSSPSFDMTFVAPIRIKNTNFGPYKYDATIVDFTYGGVVLSRVNVFKGKVGFKSTKKIDTQVLLSSSALSGATAGLADELKNGVITLGSQAQMNGKVTLMLMFKKKKSTEMNCTMAIDVAANAVKSVECK
ncbi:hypothetical protein MLD38_001739 [Melastoma candidum]|uniref:Uncharacterized protein n=1 Tax=Melastoma candidum TaxID=119954 RepID=A0ACB9SFH8_9MYRT|nr:hypothetical protein MLD38_001739 [Melastoma candidum]